MKIFLRLSSVILATTGWLIFSVAHAQSGQHLALLIGNQYYPDLNHNVDVSPNNLDAFERYLLRAETLRSDSIIRMENLAQIRLARVFRPGNGEIAKLLQANPNATRLTVYYSGHGTQEPSLMSEDKGILLGTDAQVGFEADYGVSTEEIVDNLAYLATETGIQVTLILEACFNGQTGTGEPLNDEISGSLSDETGRKSAAGVTVVSASSRTQPAYWQSSEEHLTPLSRFTDAFLDALYGYGGGLKDGSLTMSEALEMANGILRQYDSDQVATVAGFNADNLILREGAFVDREATRRTCRGEVSTLGLATKSCSAEEVQSILKARQCRYASETGGYSTALQSAEQHLISLRDTEATATYLDQQWQKSSQSANDAINYINQCNATAVSGCEQMCSNAQVLDGERKADQRLWAVIQLQKNRNTIKDYLSDCEMKVFCEGRDDAQSFLEEYERDEAIAEDLYSDYSNDPDVLNRLDRLETLIKSFPNTNTAQVARNDIEKIRNAISADQSAWRSVNQKSESSLRRYLRECSQRLICQSETEANDLLMVVQIMNEQALAAFSEAKTIPDLARKKAALSTLIESYPHSNINSDARSYLKDLNKNAKICVVRFTDRGSVSRGDFRTSSFSDLHVGKDANSSSSYHVVLNTDTVDLTVPLSFNVNGRIDNTSGVIPAGQMLAAFTQTRVRSLVVEPEFLADMKTCADFFKRKGVTPPNIRNDFIQVKKLTDEHNEKTASAAKLTLDTKPDSASAEEITPTAAEFIVTDGKKGMEISVGPINVLQNSSTSGNRLKGKSIADVVIVDAYENGVQLFDTPRLVRVVVEDGIVTLIPNNLDYDLPDNLANMRLHLKDRTTSALVFDRLKNEPEVAQEIVSLCKAMSSRGLGEQLMSRLEFAAISGNNIWDVAQRCVWAAPKI